MRVWIYSLIIYVVTRLKSMEGQLFSANCTCKTDTPPRIVKWWKLCRASIKLAGPTAQPVFQPVTLNVFPALPMFMVLSAIPSKVAKRQNFFVYQFYRLVKIPIVGGIFYCHYFLIHYLLPPFLVLTNYAYKIFLNFNLI